MNDYMSGTYEPPSYPPVGLNINTGLGNWTAQTVRPRWIRLNKFLGLDMIIAVDQLVSVQVIEVGIETPKGNCALEIDLRDSVSVIHTENTTEEIAREHLDRFYRALAGVEDEDTATQAAQETF